MHLARDTYYLVYFIEDSEQFEPEVYDACLTTIEAQALVNKLIREQHVYDAWYALEPTEEY